MRRLIFWDIDHTLIESGGVGSEVFAAAFEAATGRVLENPAMMQGGLEPGLFAAACRANGVDEPAAGLFRAFAMRQERLYWERAPQLRARGRALPGVRAVLEELAELPGVVCTVVSGNTQGAGRAKLAAFGLVDLLDLGVAAWGTDAPERPGLVPVAFARAAEQYGEVFAPGEAVLVGDTPADVAAGLAHGVRVLAVATGRTSADGLRAAGAELVFEDLAETGAVLEALLQDQGQR